MSTRRKGFVTFISGFILGAVSLYGILQQAGRFEHPGSSASAVVPVVQPKTEQSRKDETRNTSLNVARFLPPPPPIDPGKPALTPPPVLGDTPSPEEVGATLGSPISDYDRLIRRNLAMPVEGMDLKHIQDSFDETRGGTRRHEATDILAPQGTPVVAVDEGNVKKLFTSKQGGLTVYQFDNEEIYCYYYAHLDRYAEGLKEGMLLRRGDRVGYVGVTGNAPINTPHLHFAIFRLGPEKRWWEGTPINPFPVLMGQRNTR